MTLRDALLDTLRRAFRGDAWHGPALRDAVRGVHPAEAAARPIPGAHSIREIVLHAAAWTEEVARRLEGGVPALPERGDWPAAAADEETAWAEALALLDAAEGRLEALLARYPPDRLGELVGSAERDAPTGAGVTVAAMLEGLAQHHAYHAGQIVLLRRALQGGGT